MKLTPMSSMIRPILFLSVAGIILYGATAVGQPADLPQQPEPGDVALKKLRAELDEASRVWVERYREATSDEERTRLSRVSSYRTFEPRFLELARTYAGQPAAMQALQWLAETANPGPMFDEGLALVEQHHLDDEGISAMCRTLVNRRTPGIEPFLLAVAEKHAQREIRGLASLCLARYLDGFRKFAMAVAEQEEVWLDRARQIYDDTTIAWLRAADPHELSARVDMLCEQIISEYGDVIDQAYTEAAGEQRNLADSAKALSFSVHSIGRLAPELVGETVDGSQISLNSLRGQVVVLMFSADWCGPCKQMYGQLRELTKLYADQPFAVITVMADRRSSTVSSAVNSGEIAWPAIWDGEEGPIARDWNITAYPTIYLIDRDGRIRSDELRDDSLDDEVAGMLGIDPASRIRPDRRTRVWRLSLRDRNLSGEELPELLEGHTQLRELDLCYNFLSDDALIHLLPLKHLQTLKLEHAGITDEGLQRLEKLQGLKQIYLDAYPDARTTKAGRLGLMRAIPGLQLSFQEPRLNTATEANTQ